MKRYGNIFIGIVHNLAGGADFAGSGLVMLAVG